jgi:hypothetical protein
MFRESLRFRPSAAFSNGFLTHKTGKPQGWHAVTRLPRVGMTALQHADEDDGMPHRLQDLAPHPAHWTVDATNGVVKLEALARLA